MKNSVALIVFSLLLSFGVTAFSQTQDCYDLDGAAYGLCNAYCEAMDCDGEPQASEKACEKVLVNYVKITGDVPPCFEGKCTANVIRCGVVEEIMCSDGEVKCDARSCNDDCLCLFNICPITNP